MREIVIKEKTYTIPESYTELPFSAFGELQKIFKKDIGKYKKSAEIIAVLTGANYIDIYKSKPEELFYWVKVSDFVIQPVDISIMEPVRYVQDKTGNTYFVNSLDVAGDFICYEDVIMKFVDNEYDGYPVQLAFLCRKDGETLEDIQTNADLLRERIQIMKNLDTDTVFRVCSFFLQREESIQRYTALSTELQTMKETLKEQIQTDLARYTAGTSRLNTLQAASLKLILYSL